MNTADLALFPLNIVLFPGMPLPLHVFEEPYKELVKRCRENQERFGVVLVREDTGDEVAYHEVGTTARIAGVKELDEGRLNLLVFGQERFRILELFDDLPYLHATVELLPNEAGQEVMSSDLVADAGALFKEYVKLLLALSGEEQKTQLQLPQGGTELSYLVAQSLTVPMEKKQELLELESATARLMEEVEILRRENVSHRMLLTFRSKTGRGKLGETIFSPN